MTEHPRLLSMNPSVHPRNIAGCCDGTGQVFWNASGDPNGPGALTYVTLCQDAECGERRRREWDARC